MMEKSIIGRIWSQEALPQTGCGCLVKLIPPTHCRTLSSLSLKWDDKTCKRWRTEELIHREAHHSVPVRNESAFMDHLLHHHCTPHVSSMKSGGSFS